MAVLELGREYFKVHLEDKRVRRGFRKNTQKDQFYGSKVAFLLRYFA